MYGTHAQPVAASDGGRLTRTRRRLFIVPVLALTTASMVVLGGGSASAAANDPDPIGNLQDTVTKTVQKVTSPATKKAATKSSSPSRNASTPSRNAPNPPSSDSDSKGHETANPTAPDHGSSYVGHVTLGGNDLADVASGKSTVNDNDSTSADSTLLAIGGTEIIGSHADSSNGPSEDHGAFPSNPFCSSTGGMFCVDLLYSDSYATDDGSSSSSRTRNGVANACIGGDDPSGTTCSGVLGTGVASANSGAHRNQTTGRTTATSDSSVFEVCVQNDPVTGCQVKADVLSSDGQASSDSPRSASRHSRVANLVIGGTAVPVGPITSTEPFGISVPMDCPASESVLCVFGNQGETYLGQDLAGTSQTALDIFGLRGTPLELDVSLAHSETLAHNDGGTTVVSPPTGDNPPAPTTKDAKDAEGAKATSADEAASADGVLPNTGGVWSGLLSIGLLLAGAGAIALAWARRRAVLS